MPLLTVEGDAAIGHFLLDYGGFMPLREGRRDAAVEAFRAVREEEGESRATELPCEVVTDDREPFEFFAALMTGGYDSMTFIPDDGGPEETWLAQGNGSWVCHTTGAGLVHRVRQGGPAQLWDTIERAKATWDDLGQPTRERFGLTATVNSHTLWLDEPNGAVRWALPSTG